MHVLRAEKGYIIVGQDTDGTVTPDDAGLSWAIGKKKAGLRRQAFAFAPRPGCQRPKAARRPSDRRSEHGAGGRGADRRRSERGGADEDDRACHLVLLERGARPLDRHGGDRGRAGAHRQDAAHPGDPSRFDYVVVVGGLVDEIENLHPDYVGFLHRAATSKVPLVGVCTGAFVLYRAGLMDGYRCCVSWFHHDDFLGQFDGMEPVSDQIFVVDRDRLTASGGVSSAHLAAYLVDRHVGRAEARKSLNIMIIDEAMSAEAAQPGLPLELTTSDDLVRRALLLMQQAMSAPLPMSVIAKRLDVSRRKLERHFDRALGMSPAVADKLVRLTHARFLLRTPHHSIAEVAADTGFCDASHFVKVFKGYYGVTPRQLAADATRSEKSSVSADP